MLATPSRRNLALAGASLALLVGIGFIANDVISKPAHVAAPPTTKAANGRGRAHTRVCGLSLLNSPFSYTGAAGSYSSGTPGLPTFGGAGTMFPNVSAGYVIAPGNQSNLVGRAPYSYTTDALYYFEPGTTIIDAGHRFFPGANTVFIGGYSDGTRAIVSGVNGNEGEGLTDSGANGETFEYLTIENYGSDQNESVLGIGDGTTAFINGGTYEYDTIGPNEYAGYQGGRAPASGQDSGGGYAIGGNNKTIITNDCLTHDAQGAFNLDGSAGDLLTGDIISNDEISWNGLGAYPDLPGNPESCGCSGGGKAFWTTNLVVTDNYIHDNYNIGVWLDFNNAGANISHNFIASNWNYAIALEASYNANLSDNTIIGNGWASDGAWPACPRETWSCANGLGPISGAIYHNPWGAIYLANSGGDGNVASDFSGALLVDNNVLTNNFGGVDVFEDPTRYCGQSNPNVGCVLQAANSIYHLNNPWVSAATLENSTDSLTSQAGFCVETSSGCRLGTPPRAAFVFGTGIPPGDTVASCSSPYTCTLTAPATMSQTAAVAIGTAGGCGVFDLWNSTRSATTGQPSAHYYDECIWNSQNIEIKDNQFNMDSSTVTGCTSSPNDCGDQTLISEEGERCSDCYGFWNPWNLTSTQAADQVVEQNNNRWSDNAYTWIGPGAWRFQILGQNNTISAATWQGSPYSQDVGSSGI